MAEPGLSSEMSNERKKETCSKDKRQKQVPTVVK